MIYRHINTGIEKGIDEEPLTISMPPVSPIQSAVFQLLVADCVTTCLIARQEKLLMLTFTNQECELLASYTLLYRPDPSGYAWNSVKSSLKANLHKANRNPIWRTPEMPEEESWLVGISYGEIERATEPYALSLCRSFLSIQNQTKHQIA